MSEQKSAVFQLSEPLEYSKSGNKEETLEIEMIAPTQKTAKLTYKLSQYFMKASISAAKLTKGLNTDQDKIKQKKEEDPDAEEIKMVFIASDVSFDKVIDVFTFTADKFCFVDSERKIPLNRTLIGRLNFYDMTDMVCFYIANFIVPFASPTK